MWTVGLTVEIKLCFRDGLVWTVSLTVEIKLCFQISPAWCTRGLGGLAINSSLEPDTGWPVQVFYSCQRTVALSLSLCWRAIFSPCHTKSCWIGSRICFRWCEIGRSVIARSIDLICFPELHSFLFSRHASLTSRYSMCYRFVYFSSIEQHRYAISFQRINRCPVDTFWQNKNHYSLDSDLSGRWRYPLNNWD